MAAMQLHWDIFCRVIDNYGDIGVCWRLARQLAGEHGKRVRLWVDDLPSLQPLCPAVDPVLDEQSRHGIEIRRWQGDEPVDRVADVIIEAFACELPADYLAAMATTMPRPTWLNLEYLTAESWAESCHALASPHPTLPLVKHFFFPGFSAATGGLIREQGLLSARDRDLASQAPREGLEISLFCYDTAPVGALLDALGDSPGPVRLHVAPGKPLAAVSAHLGGEGPWRRGNLSVLPFDFLPQEEYDRLLWRCDINFVRGEDSFVRAQWAGHPFVWQIYQQEDDAHLVKLEAFLQRYTADFSPLASQAARCLFMAWNSAGDGLGQAWRDFIALRYEIVSANSRWSEGLAKSEDLAQALVKFCSAKV